MAEESSKLSKGFHESSQVITIRPVELSDVDDVLVWLQDDQVSRNCSWDPYHSKEEALDYIKNIAIPHPWLKVICIDNRAIGSIFVTPNSGNGKCRPELGYHLGSSFWGKGIMTKAVKIVASTVFDDFPYLERLEAYVDVDNKGSQRVLEKSGFQKEGVLRKHYILKGYARDFVIFSILSTDRSITKSTS